MDYYINPTVFSAVFTVPTALADNHLKLAKGEHIKVLLYIMRNISSEINVADISNAVGISEYDVNEALLYWADAGILLPKEPKEQKNELKPKAVKKLQKPERADVAKRGLEDEKIRYLLRETQMKFGRNLKGNETSTLVWLYDDLGLDVSLILMIVAYAVAHNNANISFIESVAVKWVNNGIDNVADADEELKRITMGKEAWIIVSNAFGLEKRKPSDNETEAALLWINEWNISKEMLVAAYNECVDQKSKFNFKYTAKIIENWHSKGYKTVNDIEKEPKKSGNENYAAYDIDLFEKMINTKD